jgi:hypothetical protein
MANTLDPQKVQDATINLLVRSLTGKIFPAILPNQYDNVYEWVRYKVEEAGSVAPSQQDADNVQYLYDEGLNLMKAQVNDAMSNW